MCIGTVPLAFQPRVYEVSDEQLDELVTRIIASYGTTLRMKYIATEIMDYFDDDNAVLTEERDRELIERLNRAVDELA